MANMVANALSQKTSSMESLASIYVDKPFSRDVQILVNKLMRLQLSDEGGVLTFMDAHSSLIDQIHEQ